MRVVKPALNTREAAVALGLSDRQVRGMLRRGEFASAHKTSDGRKARWLIAASEVEAMLAPRPGALDEATLRAIVREEIAAVLGSMRLAVQLEPPRRERGVA